MDGPLVKSGLIRGCINCTGKQFKHLIKGEEAPSDLTLFRPGGGATWRRLFPKFIWQQFDITYHCPRDLTFPWQPYFERHVFQNFNSCIKKEKSFLVAVFKSLDHFMVFLFVLITLEPILDGFLRIWANPEIQDGGPRWPTFRNDFTVMTSFDVPTS